MGRRLPPCGVRPTSPTLLATAQAALSVGRGRGSAPLSLSRARARSLWVRVFRGVHARRGGGTACGRARAGRAVNRAAPRLDPHLRGPRARPSRLPQWHLPSRSRRPSPGCGDWQLNSAQPARPPSESALPHTPRRVPPGLPHAPHKAPSDEVSNISSVTPGLVRPPLQMTVQTRRRHRAAGIPAVHDGVPHTDTPPVLAPAAARARTASPSARLRRPRVETLRAARRRGGGFTRLCSPTYVALCGLLPSTGRRGGAAARLYAAV